VTGGHFDHGSSALYTELLLDEALYKPKSNCSQYCGWGVNNNDEHD